MNACYCAAFQCALDVRPSHSLHVPSMPIKSKRYQHSSVCTPRTPLASSSANHQHTPPMQNSSKFHFSPATSPIYMSCTTHCLLLVNAHQLACFLFVHRSPPAISCVCLPCSLPLLSLPSWSLVCLSLRGEC